MAPRPESLTVRALLTMLVALGPVSTDLYLPALPALVRAFDSDIATVQLTLSVFLVGFAVAQLVYGPLSDRFGRRPVLIIGTVLYAAASVACAFAGSIEQLIAARMVQALGACCGPVVARAVVRDVFGRDRAATVLAYMAMAMTLAPAVGPIIGGVLTEALGWRSNFIVLAVFGTAAGVGSWLWLMETNRQCDVQALDPGRLMANYALLLGDRGFLAHVAVVAFAYSGIFSFISASSFVLIDRLGLSPWAYGMSFGSVVVGYASGSFLAGRLSVRLGNRRMMGLGTAVSLAAGVVGLALALGGVMHLVAIVGPTCLYFLGTGLTLPNAMAGAIGPHPTMAGLASALLGFGQMGVAACVGVAVGHLHDGTSVPMMAAIAVVALAAAIGARVRPAGGLNS